MSNRELLEYLRVFATIKMKFAEKIPGQDLRTDAYQDVLAEIDRIEVMLLDEPNVDKSALKARLETELGLH